MSITLQVQNTKEDYQESAAFVFPKTLGLRWYSVLISAIAMILIAVVGAWYKYTHLHHFQWYAPGPNGEMIFHDEWEDPTRSFFMTALLFCLGVAYLIWHFFRANLSTKRLLKKQVSLLEPSELIFSDEGLEIKRKSVKAYMEWSVVKSVYERPEFFAIIFAGGSYIPVMKKYLSETEYTELKKLLAEKREILTN